MTSTRKSAPMDTVNACVDLLPFHLLVEQVTHQAATWLTMLPTHPLAKHMQRATGRYVKHHRAPAHEILHNFNILPADFEKLRPIRCDLEMGAQTQDAHIWVQRESSRGGANGIRGGTGVC